MKLSTRRALVPGSVWKIAHSLEKSPTLEVLKRVEEGRVLSLVVRERGHFVFTPRPGHETWHSLTFWLDQMEKVYDSLDEMIDAIYPGDNQ